MDDTQVDVTKQAAIPKPMPPMDDGPSADERIASLERALHRGRIAIVVLAVAIIAAVVAMVALTVEGNRRLGVLSGTVTEQQATIDSLSSTVEELSSTASSLLSNSGSSQNPSNDQDDAEDDTPLRAADLTSLVGKKWSNALRILESYGIEPSELVIITDDGGSVINPGNWTVTMVTDLDESGQVAVHLKHDIDWP